ncbi:MAG: ABC-2 transporter permease [Candidatus Kariarchaeaceae archaeon]|jgi:hypothetical protein
MRTFTAVFKTEFRDTLAWHLAWIIGITLYSGLIVAIYPGEEAMQSFMNLLEDEFFQAFLGDIGGEDPSFVLWVAMMAPMTVLIFMIYALLAGTRLTLKSISDNTGELVHTLPIDKKRIISYRLFVTVSFFMFLLFLWLIPILLYSNTYPIIRLFNSFWWALLYCLLGIAVGMLLGVLTGSMERGQQSGLLLILFFYVFQIITRLQPDIEWINELNFLEWYAPSGVLLKNDIDWSYVIRLLVIVPILLYLAITIFDQKDLIKETGFSVNIRNRNYLVFLERYSFLKPYLKVLFIILLFPIYLLHLLNKLTVQLIIVALKSKFPIAADFVSSEKRVLQIIFWGIIMIWPGQLMAYTGDELIIEAAGGFGNNGIMRLLTYNHELLYPEPWFWYITTQAIGVHWFFFLPLTVYWINKVVKSDANNQTGEIIGSIPLSPQRVVLERFLAIVFEMLWMIIWMIFWLVLSEKLVNKTVNQFWEVIAVISLFPLYYFLLTLSLSIGLWNNRSGVKYARILVFILFMLFVIGIMNDDLNNWYITGIFGLYNPVEIIMYEQISVQNNGVLLLSIFSVFSTILLYYTSKRFSWLNIDHGKDASVQLYPVKIVVAD